MVLDIIKAHLDWDNKVGVRFWAEENLDSFLIDGFMIYFENKEDLMAFKLRWG